ncbi:MAG: hypothetical protein CM1200mP10_07250 [Candidatus Neomarinimicrobiota bacterium]|nr:MAG: hypothetical protein CM1200mP10_07250 [Candidatus Neomarinimicrobiota bacterium]
MDHLDFTWFIAENGKTVESGKLGKLDLYPGQNTFYLLIFPGRSWAPVQNIFLPFKPERTEIYH